VNGHNGNHHHHRGKPRGRPSMEHDGPTLLPRIIELATSPGNDAVFVLVGDNDEERSFSVDAIDALHTDLMVFVVSRVVHSWDKTGVAPEALTVAVHVDVT
jgi:hypothetical protein